VFDLSYLRMIPNMVIGAPADARELAGMIATAVTHDGPLAIRFPKAAAASLPALPGSPIPIGEWEELREGEDVLILASGRLVETAQKAATEASAQGVSVGVVNARWIKPLDHRLASWAAEYRAVVVLEDNVMAGGFGSAVMEELSKAGMAGKVRILGIPDRFLPSGTVDELLHEIGLDPEGVTRSVLALVAGR
jgi:1-deoxy-D-xylulose-5-phosphate synthase